MEPGPELRELQEAIPAQDPALDARLPPRELPRQLEGGSPLLAGRDRDAVAAKALAGGRGGADLGRSSPVPGIGKTRLAAELAAEVQPEAAVLYAAGSGAPDAALEAIRGAAQSELDPARARRRRRRLARPARGGGRARGSRATHRFCCSCCTETTGPPAFADAAQRLALRPCGWRPPPRSPSSTRRPTAGDAARDADGRERGGGASRSPGGQRLGAGPGGGATGSRSGHGRRRSRWAAHRPGERWREASPTSSSPASGPSLRGRGAARSVGARGVPVPRPGAVRCSPRRVLLRPRAARRRPGGAPGRLHPDRGRRAVRERQVLGASGGASAGARRRGAPRLGALAPGGDAPASIRSRSSAARWPGLAPEESRGNGDGPLAAALDSLGPTSDWCWPSISSRRSSPPAATRRARRVRRALAALAADADQRAVVVLGIRGDFYGRCAHYPELATQMGANTVLVGPMRRDELRRAIEPGEASGAAGRAVAGLGARRRRGGGARRAAAALDDPGRAVGGAERRTLREASYEASGGVSGAVARLAERAYQRLSERAARARPGDPLAPGRRRGGGAGQKAGPAHRARGRARQDAAAALAVLTESRLVTVDEGTVEVAHEALLRSGRGSALARRGRRGPAPPPAPDSSRGGVAGSGREPGELYRGARLASALEWAESHDRA